MELTVQKSVCPDCGKQCNVIIDVDSRNWTEYWGFKSYDRGVERFFSDCCEAEIVNYVLER
jgi:hypothetical protein